MTNFKIPDDCKTVVIVGVAASGKTSLASLLKEHNPRFTVINTDDYKKYDWDEALDLVARDVSFITTPLLVEGVLAYRLLRRGAQRGNFHADLVFKCEVSKKQRAERFTNRGGQRSLDGMKSMDSMLMKVYHDYEQACNRSGVVPKHVYRVITDDPQNLDIDVIS